MNMLKQQSSNFLQYFLILTVLFSLVLAGNALGLDLTVIGENNDGTTTQLTEFRWLIEEDQTYHVTPGVPDPNTLAVSFHQSYMPITANGDETSLPTTLALDPDKHYYVSVLPKTPGTYSIGGAQIAPGQTAVSVSVNQLPLPAAQISIFVFEDDFPINSAPDLPAEQGIAGVQILVEDAGGKYGMSAGAQMADVFGNMLGTVYDQTCDVDGLNPGTGTSSCMDADGPVCVLNDLTPDPADCLVEPLVTGADGRLLIKNIAPGKYGIQAVPPAGYQQTSTIEGTKVIDAWVKAGEPPFFAEFGPPGEHVFIGFINQFNNIPAGGTTAISGQVVNLHLSRPPNTAFYNGAPFEHTTAWVGLNDNAGLTGASQGLYAARANDDGTFSIPNVPAGDYQLAVWDDNLDIVFAFHNVTVNADGSCVTANGSCDLGEVPVFQWFTRLEAHVFDDANENGIRDPGEGPIPEQGVNIRWRDGTMYQSFPTDIEGAAPFDQVFPFFSWLVAEVDFARLKATGVTVTVDDGGQVPLGEHMAPQAQNNPLDPEGNFYASSVNRTEVGPVLTQAFQGFLGQTSILEWGKTAYAPGENGGISGMVFYAVTRAEDDPALAAAEPWEPGIPRVQVNLYQDSNYDSIPDDRHGNGIVQLTDVDNYPFQWSRPHQFLDDGSVNPEWTGTPGPEDLDRNNNGDFNIGDAINITWTDSWDDSLPTECQYGINAGTGTDDPFVFRGVATDCYDGMRNWNQVRPGVFDGGYAFTHYYPRASDGVPAPPWSADGVETPLPAGIYIVEASVPNGYELLKEEDRNVDFGDEYTPNVALIPSVCVGDDHLVPAELTLFPGVAVGSGYGNTNRPLCDRKQVLLSDGANAVAEFFMFTDVPISAHIKGFILDDTANEGDPNSPQFGEKYAPPYLPVSIRDYTGREIGRTYSDEYGTYNALVPSTYTTNLPAPSGMSPNMLTTCMNDPVLPDGTTDPQFNSQYSSFCYTFQYMPGSTTYLDTPVVPVAAMAGPDLAQLDCEFPNGTPVIREVTARGNALGGGPYDPFFHGLIIRSAGLTLVPNPAYDGVGGTEPKLIQRDFTFGNQTGQVLLDGTPIPIQAWNGDRILINTMPTNLAGQRQLEVVRADGTRSIAGVTVQVGPLPAGTGVHTVSSGGSIQAAIDVAAAGDLILIEPGIYPEMVVMWKPVQLQGWGAGSSIISAVNAPDQKLLDSRLKVQEVVEGGLVDLLPGQQAPFGGNVADALFAEEGAGILVLARNDGSFSRANAARIDGLTVTSASSGGGIVVNGYASFLTISNNRVTNNHGTFGGGIRLGHPQLTNEVGGMNYTDAQNNNIEIHNNHITQNGGLNGSGGGVSICTGSDRYQVVDNYICGNFTMGHGGGIGHLGESNGLISGNTILFNENFNQGLTVSGGGISIAGQQPLPGTLLSPGSGNVTIEANTIQGNLAGAGDGGGIHLSQVNGADVAANPDLFYLWNRIDLINNMITNNVAGLAGAGVSLQDTLSVRMIFNTIANNDSTATASGAFTPANPNTSNPQPAGLVSRAHSTELAGVIGNVSNRFTRGFSNPYLRNNIIWHNRSFYFSGDPTVFPPVYQLYPDIDAGAAPVYDDLAVLGINANMSPRYTLFSETYVGAGHDHATNITAADAGFVFDYQNGGLGNTVRPGEVKTSLAAPVAFDEGGNFIQIRFGPLTTEGGDYHLQATSVAVDSGTANIPAILGTGFDIDAEARPAGANVDIGADEQQ